MRNLIVVEVGLPFESFDARKGFVHGNAREPCDKCRASFKLSQMLVSADVCILHHVFCLPGIFQDAERDGIDHASVSIKESSHRLVIAGSHSVEQQIVR